MISRAELDGFRAGVTGAADEASEWVASELSSYMGAHPEATVEDLRERAIDALLTADSTFGERACEVAAQMFERTCPGTRPAVLADATPRADAEGIARYQAGKLAEDDRDGFVRQVSQAARDSVMRRSNETTARNAARNASSGVRYARVPTGGETCPWCLMLASNGFYYRSSTAATHSHRHCDCVAVAARGVDRDGRDADGNPLIEGYDRSPYLDAYARALENEELTPSQLARAAKRAGSSPSSRSYRSLIADVSGAEDRRALEEAYIEAYEQMSLRGASAATWGSLSEAMRERTAALASLDVEPSSPVLGPIAGVAPGRPMTFERADSGNVNPGYTGPFSKDGYDSNCQTCVVAFEARLRGYDVKARPNLPGSVSERLACDSRLAWIDPQTGKRPTYVIDSGKRSPKKTLAKIETAVESGARYTLEFDWESGGGHIVNFDLDPGGRPRIKDNQRGDDERSEWVGDEAVLEYLQGTRCDRRMGLLRVDNLDFDQEIIDGILEAR